MQFHQPGIFNYSALLLSEDKDTLYVGAREAVFALNALNISQKQHEVWRGLPLPCCLGRRPARCVLESAHWAVPGASGPFLAVWPAHRACPVPLASSLPPSADQGPCHPEASFAPCVRSASSQDAPWQPVLAGLAAHPHSFHLGF